MEESVEMLATYSSSVKKNKVEDGETCDKANTVKCLWQKQLVAAWVFPVVISTLLYDQKLHQILVGRTL